MNSSNNTLWIAVAIVVVTVVAVGAVFVLTPSDSNDDGKDFIGSYEELEYNKADFDENEKPVIETMTGGAYPMEITKVSNGIVYGTWKDLTFCGYMLNDHSFRFSVAMGNGLYNNVFVYKNGDILTVAHVGASNNEGTVSLSVGTSVLCRTGCEHPDDLTPYYNTIDMTTGVKDAKEVYCVDDEGSHPQTGEQTFEFLKCEKGLCFYITKNDDITFLQRGVCLEGNQSSTLAEHPTDGIVHDYGTFIDNEAYLCSNAVKDGKQTAFVFNTKADTPVDIKGKSFSVYSVFEYKVDGSVVKKDNFEIKFTEQYGSVAFYEDTNGLKKMFVLVNTEDGVYARGGDCLTEPEKSFDVQMMYGDGYIDIVMFSPQSILKVHAIESS